MYKILLVEDDEAISNSITQYLKNWGYDVAVVRDFANVTNEFNKANPHIVLLDIMLPFYDGYYWCKEIRKISNVPIVFISSASDNMNIVMAVNLGGDDFIAKPFDLNVLLAKVQAILRRTYDMSGGIAVIEHKGVTLNINNFTLSYQNKALELTKNEFRILETLLTNKGKVVSRDTLMTKLWQDDNYVEENTLTVNVNRLRKKLDNLGATDFIKTKIGCGYIVEL
ncbi:MAG: response regulator transcription factor [Clostridia bacterium]|nr:response regulator transcription factor [Clostridia bacterium]